MEITKLRLIALSEPGKKGLPGKSQYVYRYAAAAFNASQSGVDFSDRSPPVRQSRNERFSKDHSGETASVKMQREDGKDHGRKAGNPSNRI
jgi:hypothetical protein